MSVAVAIDALREHLAEFGRSAYLVTVGADGRAHVVSVRARMDDGCIYAGAGRTSRQNARLHADVTLLWPAREGEPYSLIVDGAAQCPDDDDADLVVRPSRAVLHRVVSASSDLPSCVPIE